MYVIQNLYWNHMVPSHCFPNGGGRLCWGDEIDVLNDSWMFLIWTSDHSPYRTNSVSSRWPIVVIPQSLYLHDASGVNLTIAAATAEIVTSFNRPSTTGLKIRELPSLGGSVATRVCFWTVFVWECMCRNILNIPQGSTLYKLISCVPASLGGATPFFRDGVQRRLEGFSPSIQLG